MADMDIINYFCGVHKSRKGGFQVALKSKARLRRALIIPHISILCWHKTRVRTYRDTGSVEPGSEPIFGSVSGSENQIFGILCDKDTFCLYYRYILWFFRYRACILVLVRRSILSVSVLTLPKTLFMDYAYCDSLTNSKVPVPIS